MPLSEHRNITRYTYAKTSFQGWRVCLGRNRRLFTRYFSDKALGGEEKSFAAARELRDSLLAELQTAPDNIEAIFEKYSAPKPPAGKREKKV